AYHFQCGQCSLGTLVAGLGAGTLDGLLDGIDGQYTEGDRHAKLHGDLGQALGAFTGDVFEVRSAATNDRTQGDDGVVLALLGDLLCNQRNLEGTRRTDDDDIVFANTVAHQRINGATYQALDDEAVEAAHYQGEFPLRGDEGTFDGLQG